jgi:protein-disulfide isomerase
MTRTRWIIFAVICVVVFGIVILTNRKTNTQAFTGDATKVITDGPIPDHTFGSVDNKVILIEYGDYQCPACGAMYASVKDITEQYKTQLTFVFRNFPLTTVHLNALAAAGVAEAAGRQGKYFEMHDKLYETQATWGEASANARTGIFEQYAKDLGLNIDEYKQALSSSEVNQKIDRDRSSAQVFDTNATPTFILNGEKLPEAVSTSPDQLKSAVKDALEKAGYKLDS